MIRSIAYSTAVLSGMAGAVAWEVLQARARLAPNGYPQRYSCSRSTRIC
jgi:hypothetical protein